MINGQQLTPGQWIPIKPGDQVSVKSTTVRGTFELIAVLEKGKK